MKTRLIGAIVSVVLAAVGGLVLIGYVSSADLRAARGAELVSAYVVTAEVPARTRGEEIGQFIRVDRIPARTAVPGRVTDLDDLRGAVNEVALRPGEQLIASRWTDPAAAPGRISVPDGMQAVSVALAVERVVGGAVESGDTVGVLISADQPYVPPAYTRQAFHKVLVLDVQAGSSLPGDGDSGGEPVEAFLVTLALPTPDVEALVWGQEFGTLWLTLEPESADERGGRKVDGPVVFP